MASDTPAEVGQYLRWLDTDMPACDNCGAVIVGDLIRHAPDCSFITAIRAEERERIRNGVDQLKRELWSGNGYMWPQHIADLLDGDTDHD